MKDVITFGSASFDIYINPSELKILDNPDFISGEALAFNLGSKVTLKKVDFNIGGGGVNTAFSFKNYGLDVSYLGCLGLDAFGSQIIDKLKKQKIGTSFIQKTEKAQTNCSIILNIKGKDRTIMVYRGASQYLENISFLKLKAKWFYLAPMSGKIAHLTEEIVDFGKNNNTKIAFNPGKSQLNIPTKKIRNILKKVDVLILNQEEASILTKNEYKKEVKILKDLSLICDGIVVMTKGKRGVSVIDLDKNIHERNAEKIKIIDTTGAGDAFGSGFVSGLIKFNDVDMAIDLALKNSKKCIKKQGTTS